ncbi:MAG: HNH endonuclease family protein, partial [Lachnospiraceae bacterium]|nr:HNH endonuclease family protein [Lachnospiraceae bacterium]
VLKDWFSDHEFYHKVGFLIASGAKSISEIYRASRDKKKSEFRQILDDYIRESIRIEDNYAELSYEENGDAAKISRLLLLFNIESVRRIEQQSQWFPFDRFKANDSWTLEHIHAQQSEGMNKQEEWRMWLSDHVQSLRAIEGKQTELAMKIEELLEKKDLKKHEFEKVQKQVIERLSVQGNGEYLHSIGNLALLNSSDNAALSNSTFDVKRNKIIEMDQKGLYIPFCTKMVFLKYYTPSEGNQVHFWGQQDRIAYIRAINAKLEGYLEEPISVEGGE